MHPLGDEGGLGRDDVLVECEIGPRRAGRAGDVAGDGVIGETTQEVEIPLFPSGGRGIFEAADPQMARGDADQYGARQKRVPNDLLSRGDDGESARSRDPERVHRLADQVLAQHRSDRGLAVSAAGEGGPARSFEVDIAATTPCIDDLAEQQRAAIAEARRVASELVAGVGHRKRRRALGHRIADQHVDAVARGQGLGIEAELGRQRGVQDQDLRSRDGRGAPGLVETREVAGIAVVEAEERSRAGHASRLTAVRAERSRVPAGTFRRPSHSALRAAARVSRSRIASHSGPAGGSTTTMRAMLTSASRRRSSA